ncbi:hypothetical protein CsSME_00007764 [Camellia sinensis var. sinensis]
MESDVKCKGKQRDHLSWGAGSSIRKKARTKGVRFRNKKMIEFSVTSCGCGRGRGRVRVVLGRGCGRVRAESFVSELPQN